MKQKPLLSACACVWLSLTACGGGSSTPVSVPPPAATAPAITTQPVNQSVTVGQAATFSVTASGTSPLTYQWSRGGNAINGATAASYTTAATAASDSGSVFTVTVSNAAGASTSSAATLTVTEGTPPATGATTDVTMFKYDLSRSGTQSAESVLTPANVNQTSFGRLRTISVDGKVDATPLYLSQLMVGGTAHNVLFIVTEHNSVFAIDADSGATLWQVSATPAGETTSDARACGQISPEIGITATPAIDRGAGRIYVVAASKDGAGAYHHRLHALDLATGAELSGSPVTIAATFPNSSGSTTFDPRQYAERAALVLNGGKLYTAWTSHCDAQPYSGWVMSFQASTLTPLSVLNIAANSSIGPAIWMSGGGPAVDAAGNLYLLAANGLFDTALDGNGFPVNGDYGNAFIKISDTNNVLQVADYFAMSNANTESGNDVDLGSGSAMLLPDLTDALGAVRHLAIGAGKDSIMYVVDRDSMGKFVANNGNLYQQVNNALQGAVFSTPSYFNGNVYYGAVGQPIRAFPVAAAKVAAVAHSASAVSFGFPGASTSISANGTSNGILWAVNSGASATLYAFDAANLATLLYNSDQAGTRDQFGAYSKFLTPVVADGKVFITGQNSVVVFGLLGK